MASNLGRIWVALPPIVQAALKAAWAASKFGAISLATLFTIVSLGFGIYEVAAGHAHILELPGIILGAAAIFLLSFLFSLAITVPVSAVAAAFAYPLLGTLRSTDRRTFGIVGFLVGVLVWLGVWWIGPAGNLYFGSWLSVFVIGGSSGCAGGLAFARNLPRETSSP